MKALTSLKGKVALITGASRGIGRATAIRLAEGGAAVVMGATSVTLLKSLQQELEERGRDARAQRCDITQREECENLVHETLSRFGKIDILVNNAGVGFSGTIVDSDPDMVERMVAVNILGVYYITRAILPGMINRQRGDIINIGSVAGIKYSPRFAIYSATKFAVRAFSEALRNEVQEHNIRVTLVQPGMTQTAFFDSFARKGSPIPLDKGEILRPEDIADAIYFALSRPDGVAVNDVTVRPVWQER